MEDMREFLEDWALSVQRETLTRDREYRELERRRKELFTQLTQGDRALTVEDGLALLDLTDEMAGAADERFIKSSQRIQQKKILISVY